MFTNKTSADSSASESQQVNPYLRTMQGDLASASNTSTAQPAEKLDAPRPDDNHDNRPVQALPSADSLSPSQNQPPVIDSSSPFSKTYFQEEAATSIAGPSPLKNIPAPAEPTAHAQEPITQSSRSVAKLITIFISIVILCSLVAGGYFYWKTRSPQPIAGSPTPQSHPLPSDSIPPVKVNPLAEKYSSQNPNYLSVDTNTATPESIRKQLSDTASEISQSGLTVPVEFVVTDSNNNPVVFHIFCALAKIDLPPTLLSALGDTFSLYIYSDAGNMRLGLSVDSKGKATTAARMKVLESKLSTLFSLLFLDNPVEQPVAFKDGTYNGSAVRYVNLNQAANISVDYTIDDTSLLLGTSKNTLRAMLDKFSSPTNAPPPTSASLSAPPSQNDTSAAPTSEDTTIQSSSPATATATSEQPAN